MIGVKGLLPPTDTTPLVTDIQGDDTDELLRRVREHLLTDYFRQLPCLDRAKIPGYEATMEWV